MAAPVALANRGAFLLDQEEADEWGVNKYRWDLHAWKRAPAARSRAADLPSIDKQDDVRQNGPAWRGLSADRITADDAGIRS